MTELNKINKQVLWMDGDILVQEDVCQTSGKSNELGRYNLSSIKLTNKEEEDEVK